MFLTAFGHRFDFFNSQLRVYLKLRRKIKFLKIKKLPLVLVGHIGVPMRAVNNRPQTANRYNRQPSNRLTAMTVNRYNRLTAITG
jgi:hypothetical protein